MAAFLLEIALIIVFVPLLLNFDPARVVPYVGIGCFVFGFVITWLVVRTIHSRPVLHGTLIGVLATAIYLVLCLVGPGGLAPVIAMYGPKFFVIGNGVRILGCIAGGYACKETNPLLS